MTDTPLTGRTLAALVAEDARRAAALDALGLDYCCHGDRSLADACAAAGVDTEAVVAQLAALADDAAAGDVDTAALAPADLVDHLEATHHRYLHDELPALDALAAKVLAAHGERHPELVEVQRLVTALRFDLEPHLMKEEAVLFPAIRRLAAGEPLDLRAPIRVMGTEHEQAGELLAALRDATGGYGVPEDGCASYRLLYERLAELERDTHLHIHKENYLLFPAVLEAVG